METIQIPHVELVDIFGRNLGVFDEDPHWWKNVNPKLDPSSALHAPVAVTTTNELSLDANNEKVLAPASDGQVIDNAADDANKTSIIKGKPINSVVSKPEFTVNETLTIGGYDLSLESAF